MNKTLGIDISTYQNGINLCTAKNEDVDFVIIRGSFTGYANKSMSIDDRFIEHYDNAKKNGLNVGVYHFSRATTYEEGKKEAEFLYNNCLVGRKFEYPIYIDVEDGVYQAKATKENITSAIKGFCEYIEEKGFYVGIYCNLNWANNYMNYNELAKKYDFWLAYWGENEPRRGTYGNYGLWQFGGETNLLRSNKIAGMTCDQNYSFKDYPSIIKNNNLNNFINEKNEPTIEEIEDTNIIKEPTIENKEETVKKHISIFTAIFELLKKVIDYIISKFTL